MHRRIHVQGNSIIWGFRLVSIFQFDKLAKKDKYICRDFKGQVTSYLLGCIQKCIPNAMAIQMNV